MSAEGPVPSPRANDRSGRFIAFAIAAVVVALAAFAAGWLLGARRTVLSTAAPTGDGVAAVLEARCSLGRCQSLWIGPAARDVRMVEALTSDEHAQEIAWTPDGGRVAFLVNGYQLRVFDAHTGRNLGATSVIDPDGNPPSRIARGVTFSANGAAVTFDDCPREHSGCKPGIIALRLR